MEKEKARFTTRLRRALQEAGYGSGQTTLAREFNQRYHGKSIVPNTARKWLHGQSIPGPDKIVVLSNWLKVPIEEFYVGGVHAAKEPRTRWDPEAVGHREHEIITAFLKLSAPQQRIIRDMIAEMLKGQGPI